MLLSSTPPAPAPQTLTVSQLVDRIKNAVRISVGHQWVEGEISNLRIQSSGHAYFTLKDAAAQIACVLFKQRAAGSRVALKEGIKVRVYGEATMYEQRGQLQLVLSKVEPAGIGDLQARFLELKEKLKNEGLFDEQSKKPVPAFPAAVGIITSPTGAVIQDIRNVFEQRSPWLKAYLLPVPVQGDAAASKIAAAIRAWGNAPANGLPRIDTLIIARGGGSIEDLWPFNEEIVARAIHACPIPVISGVGHETDFTIADFVADLRAPTPTAAAMLAAPGKDDLLNRIESIGRALSSHAARNIRHARLQLSFYERSPLGQPRMLLEPFAQLIDSLELELKNRHPRLLNDKREQTLRHMQISLIHSFQRKLLPLPRQIEFLAHQLTETADRRIETAASLVDLLESKLDARNPVQTLDRGFALVRNGKGGIVTSPADANKGDRLTITVKGGDIEAVAE